MGLNCNEYFLMNKDKIILRFATETNEYNETLLIQLDEDVEGLPIGFEDLETFIKSRKAPKHRAHVNLLMKQLGCDNTEGFLRITHALSLNDTFWVRPVESTLRWADVSLYTNDFNEVIAHLAFEGGEGNIRFSSTSPEFGTSGAYAKCWVRDAGNVYLIKTGSDKYGTEPFSEFYASQLSKVVCPHFVPYSIEMFRGRLVSKCPLFTSEQEGYVSAMKIVDEKSHDKVSYLLDFFSTMGFEDDFRRMLVLDALLINTDRHTGNYGVIVGNNTQEVLRFAPVFDHNRSLLFDLPESAVDNPTDHIRKQIPRIGGDFNTAAHLMLTPAIRSDLLNLRGFKFERDHYHNLSDKRLSALERMIDNQIENILGSRSLYFYKDLAPVNYYI